MAVTLRRKTQILGAIEDLVGSFLYYDRKEDEDLPEGSIQNAIADGLITADEIIKQFSDTLREGLKREII
jgi:hypothetical protein